MRNWLLGVLGALAAVVGWIARGFLAARTEERLTKERDAALAGAKEQAIKAAAKAREADVLHKQQKTEDAIHVADGGDISARLDSMYGK
jgi:hypothetical protein